MHNYEEIPGSSHDEFQTIIETQPILEAPFPGTIEDNALLLKKINIMEKEAELERRERELQIREGAVADVKPKNWPICKPFLHHDIRGDIQPGLKQKVALSGYYGWFALCAILFLNFTCAVITIFMPVDSNNGIQRTIDKFKFVLFAVINIPLGIGGHFALCYWPLYKALSTLTIGRYTLFFVGYGLAIIVTLFMAAGWYDYGACGLVVAIMYFPTSTTGNGVAFGLNLMMAALWSALAILFIVIYILNIKIARKENHSFAKAVDVTKSALVSTVGKVTTDVLTGNNNEVSSV